MDHLHVNAATAVSVFLMVIVTVGTANIVAKKYQGHPAAEGFGQGGQPSRSRQLDVGLHDALGLHVVLAIFDHVERQPR